MAKDEEYEIHRTGGHHLGPAKLKTYQNKTRAYNEVDRLDNEYGRSSHRVHRVPKESQQSHWGSGEGNKSGDVK